MRRKREKIRLHLLPLPVYFCSLPIEKPFDSIILSMIIKVLIMIIIRIRCFLINSTIYQHNGQLLLISTNQVITADNPIMSHMRSVKAFPIPKLSQHRSKQSAFLKTNVSYQQLSRTVCMHNNIRNGEN